MTEVTKERGSLAKSFRVRRTSSADPYYSKYRRKGERDFPTDDKEGAKKKKEKSIRVQKRRLSIFFAGLGSLKRGKATK